MRVSARLTAALLVYLTILAGGLSLLTPPLRAIPEYTAKEEKECEFCHPNNDPYALNEAGKYYAEHRSFEGYGDAPAPAKPAPSAPKPESPKPQTEPVKPDPVKPEPANPKQTPPAKPDLRY